jgi:ethanolamine ammonia-lyase large subunit
MDAQQLRSLLVLANPFKEGDLAVGGTRDEQVRDDARQTLRATTLGTIDATALVDDDVSESLARSVDRELNRELRSLHVGQLASLLQSKQRSDWVTRFRSGLTSESIAAVVKVMSDEELSTVARGLFNPLPGDGVTIGSPQHFGSRIQPNSPGDSDDEILFSIFEGLTYGCGDVIIGLNPASDELDTIARLEQLLGDVVRRLELPTRYCVLSDLPKQHRARSRVRVDVGFQSLAGTSRALAGMVGLGVDGVLDLAREFEGLYFETGQGSAVTNGAAENVDMVTLESRTYGLARHIRQQTGRWMIVNDVAGFIGPEVFRTAEQLERACLEDAVMAKLHGLTMGLDVCSTFHMGIAPATLRHVTERVAERAAPAYLMAVAGNADPMLGYLTTSFREHPRLRARNGRQITSAMSARLRDLQGASVASLYARYARSSDEEGRLRLKRLRDRGFDLGYGSDERAAAEQRVDAIYEHARLALYAVLEHARLADVVPNHLRVKTTAVDRDDYLAHPTQGERLHADSIAALTRAAAGRRPQVQLVISDGLNANAIHEQVRPLVPALRRLLRDAGIDLGERVIVVTNGRVRAGYHVAEIIGPEVLAHIIGERPGTGLNTASVYVTYGRDRRGQLRWTPTLDHSFTTAVCGIHPDGKPPERAAVEVARTIARILKTKRSGVAADDGD